MFNRVILIGRLGQNAEAKTAQNNREYVVLNIATQESWKNDKGEYETRTEWHRIFAWSNLSKFAKTLQRGSSSLWKALCVIVRLRMTSRALGSSTGSPKFMPRA
jgi:single stranded DNA-binding protein